MLRIYSHYTGILTLLLCPILGYSRSVVRVVVHADERGRDVGLLVQMSEAEPRQGRCVVENSGLVFRGETGGESVTGLRTGAVHAVDQGWDSSWW